MPADAPPLGIVPSAKFVTEEVVLDGGQFIMCTDGITEFRFGDEELGTEGLDMLMNMNREKPIRERLQAVIEELEKAGWRSRDDLTLLAIDDGMAAAAWESSRRA